MRKAFLSAALTSAACGGAGEASESAEPGATVFAAASLRELLEAAAALARERGVAAPRLEFDATSALARRIDHGAGADLFVAAAPEWLAGRAPLARFDWLTNRLVLVVRADAADPDLDALESLALANEQAPAGAYGRAALARQRIPLPRRVVCGQSVRGVLSTVAEGGAAAGVVYATDAPLEPRVRVALRFPAESHPPIVIGVGVLREAGLRFGELLRSDAVLARARALGFGVP
jgi:molybdate transport system substrate-binding protein